MSARKRPIAVSIISWYLIIGAGWSILNIPFSLNNQVVQRVLKDSGAPPVAVVLMGLSAGIVDIIAAVAMLKGRRWGRTLYLIVTPLLILLSAALFGFTQVATLVIGLVLYAVFFIFLTRRAASDYFSNSIDTIVPSPDAIAEPSTRKGARGKNIVSITLLIVGGSFLNAWSMTILPLSESLTAIMIVSGIFGILACAAIIPAILLWGRHRWAGILGILFIAVGAMLLCVFLVFVQINSMPEFRDQLVTVDPKFFYQMIRGSLVFGIAEIAIGVGLFYLQRKKDTKPRKTPVGNGMTNNTSIPRPDAPTRA